MCAATSARVTKLLAEWGNGDQDAREALIPLVYGELRRMARRFLRRERVDHTLQSAGLVNEAYLRLVRANSPQLQNRAHFFGVAAQLMRQILIDHARSRLAVKRGAGAPHVMLTTGIGFLERPEVDLIALDDALTKLASLDLQQSRIVELRYFAELSIEETALVVGVSPATVKRDWATARVWLRRELNKNARS